MKGQGKKILSAKSVSRNDNFIPGSYIFDTFSLAITNSFNVFLGFVLVLKIFLLQSKGILKGVLAPM